MRLLCCSSEPAHSTVFRSEALSSPPLCVLLQTIATSSTFHSHRCCFHCPMRCSPKEKPSRRGLRLRWQVGAKHTQKQPKPLLKGSSFRLSVATRRPIFLSDIDTLFQNFPSVNRNFNTRFHVLPIPSIFPPCISHFILANYFCVGITIIKLH